MLAVKIGDPLNFPGAVVQSTPQVSVAVNGVLLAVVGATVSPHGLGPHGSATFPTGSLSFKVNGLGVILTGAAASCGHTVVGTAPVDATA